MLAVLALLAASCNGGDAPAGPSALPPAPVVTTPAPVAITPPPETTPPGPPSSQDPDATIDDLLADLEGLSFGGFVEESYINLLLRDPEFLTRLGISDRYRMRNDQLNHLSEPFLTGTQRLEAGTLELLRSYDREALSTIEQDSYDIYEWYLSQRVAGHRFRYYDYPVHHFVNSYNDNLILFLTEEHPMDSPEDAEDYISRVSQIEGQVDDLLGGLEIRRELGLIPPDFILTMTIARLTSDLGTTSRDPELVEVDRLELFTSFRDRLQGIDGLGDADRQVLLDAARLSIERSFVPAWIALIEHLETLRPLAQSDPGVWRFPDGDAYYAHLLRGHTSTGLTAEEIHQIGLTEVERVTAEMRVAFDALGYPADEGLGELRSRAAGDGGFVGGSTDAARQEALATMEGLIVQADAASAEYFARLPEANVVVVLDEGGGGFYVPASVDGSRPGSFHAGVSATPLYIIPTITYHEAIPGHHLQIALAQELNLPSFRRFIQYDGFIEGWALYAERLAWEMGLYDEDPYGNIGRLELELVRAVRLVVDTGIHALGWTREEATAYMDETIGDSSWSQEVTRYAVLPGQATGYMIGQKQILDLRQKSAEAYGDGFDIAVFHDLVLGGGSLPLEVLERRIAPYLAAAPPPPTTTIAP
jgi:uncharacterized protein (DUF885 family)